MKTLSFKINLRNTIISKSGLLGVGLRNGKFPHGVFNKGDPSLGQNLDFVNSDDIRNVGTEFLGIIGCFPLQNLGVSILFFRNV